MEYRREIDGLRAIAVVSVILAHAGFNAFSGGYVGVDVFFVISGFLITRIIMDDVDGGRFSLLGFYKRRARRILPALIVVVGCCLPAAWFLLRPSELAYFSESVTSSVLFFSNLFFAEHSSGYFATPSKLTPLLHTWSLSVEEQFYILYPAILLVALRLLRRGPVITVAAITVFSLALSLSVDANSRFFLLPYRAWELGIGALCALSANHYKQKDSSLFSVVGLFFIVLSVLLYTDETPSEVKLYALMPVAGAALIILFCGQRSVVFWLLTRPAVVFVGLISYSAYLWHQPVFSFARIMTSTITPGIMISLIFLVMVLSVLTWRYIEKPFRGEALRKKRAWLAACLPLMAVAGFTTSSIALSAREYVPQYQYLSQRFSENFIDYAENINVRLDCPTVDGYSRCEIGMPDGTPDVVVWGDSLALALAYGLDAELKSRGLSGVVFGKDACPPVLGLKNLEAISCDGAVHDKILEQILTINGDVDVVLHGSLFAASFGSNVRIDDARTSPAAIASKLSAMKSSLNANGMRLVLLDEGPMFYKKAVDYYIDTAQQNNAPELSIKRQQLSAKLAKIDLLKESVDRHISSVDFFCDAHTCPAMDVKGRLIIYDTNHVTKEYSVKLGKYLLERLEHD